jgi:hypothetical protein
VLAHKASEKKLQLYEFAKDFCLLPLFSTHIHIWRIGISYLCERISHSRNSEKNRLNEKNHTPLTHSHQTHEHASPTQHNLQAVALLFQELQIYMPNNHKKTDVKSYE